MTYTEEEIQKHNEIFVKEVRLFGMTFKFYVFKDSKGEYTNLALYKCNFFPRTYEELNVYFLDMIDGEELDRLIKNDLREYLMRPAIRERVARYHWTVFAHSSSIK